MSFCTIKLPILETNSVLWTGHARLTSASAGQEPRRFECFISSFTHSLAFKIGFTRVTGSSPIFCFANIALISSASSSSPPTALCGIEDAQSSVGTHCLGYSVASPLSHILYFVPFNVSICRCQPLGKSSKVWAKSSFSCHCQIPESNVPSLGSWAVAETNYYQSGIPTLLSELRKEETPQLPSLQPSVSWKEHSPLRQSCVGEITHRPPILRLCPQASPNLEWKTKMAS